MQNRFLHGYQYDQFISWFLAFGLGALLISIFSARHFGRCHEGNTASRT